MKLPYPIRETRFPNPILGFKAIPCFKFLSRLLDYGHAHTALYLSLDSRKVTETSISLYFNVFCRYYIMLAEIIKNSAKVKLNTTKGPGA